MDQGLGPVAATADDSILSKVSCVRLNYFKDPFLRALFEHKKNIRRQPIINRGYYARVNAFDKIIIDFLQSDLQLSNNNQSQSIINNNTNNGNINDCNSKKQIISLGAGIDTSFWRLSNKHPKLFANNLQKYIEIDFPQTCRRKISLLKKHSKLFLTSEILGYEQQQKAHGNEDETNANAIYTINEKKWTLISNKYALISGDLTHWEQLLQDMHPLLNYNSPTLIFSECCLIYIPWQESLKIIEWSANAFSNGCSFVVYEQIKPNDAFGQQMIRNLRQRDLRLCSYEKYPDLISQQTRFIDAGFDISLAWDMNQIYREYFDREKTNRIENLEMFDEYEEWHIFMAHYFISCSIVFPKVLKKKSTQESNNNIAVDDEQKNSNEDGDIELTEYQETMRNQWRNLAFLKHHQKEEKQQKK